MTPIHDHEAETLMGGALVRLNVNPTVNVGNTVVPQVNAGAAVGVLGTATNDQSNISRVVSSLGGGLGGALGII
ncbi:MAG: hypothetical protein ACKOCM_09140 [Cyanobacteriota bacterium]